jgi:hypothetical protein
VDLGAAAGRIGAAAVGAGVGTGAAGRVAAGGPPFNSRVNSSALWAWFEDWA